ncbi:MocR-like transcription factor YczR [Angustibacter aerolatus]
MTADRRAGARELSRLLAHWEDARRPAYLALSERVRLLVLDGRLPVGVRLPPERELAGVLGVSRTTVSAAFDALRRGGYVASRQGSGSWTTVPTEPTAPGQVPAWAPEPVPDGVLDLAHAAPPAPPQLHAAYAAALDELPKHLPTTGYDYRGLPVLRTQVAERLTARGLPTAPGQVLVTAGGLQGIRLALQLLLRPGDRVLVEQPGYPNGLDVLRDLGARPVPVPVTADGWDRTALEAAARQTAPRAAYLTPDFQNPSGALMDDATRQQVATTLARHGVPVVVDESLVELHLDDPPAAPRPFAAHAPRGAEVITVGSASKAFWGGLRIGWLRAGAATTTRLAGLRTRVDLAGPVLEQLAVTHLLRQLDDVLLHHRDGLRARRALLQQLLADHLPSWRYATPPGGSVLWCALPAPVASHVSVAADALGVRVTPGSRFAVDGTLESWMRLPYTRPADELRRAVPLVAQAFEQVTERPPRRAARPPEQFVV